MRRAVSAALLAVTVLSGAGAVQADYRRLCVYLTAPTEVQPPVVCIVDPRP